MSRARPSISPERQTAASDQSGGCLSAYLLPPLTVLLVGALMALFVRNLDFTVQAESMSQPQGAELTPSESISVIFTDEVQYWSDSIVRWASSAGVNPDLAAVVMQIESCGDPQARSRAGAIGLFQVMPYHFQIGDNPYDPGTNAMRGLAYLKRSLEAAGGNPRLALAGYNGGIGIIQRAESGWSAETMRYVSYGVPIYEDAASGKTSSAMLAAWYNRYGVGLCQQARRRLGLP